MNPNDFMSSMYRGISNFSLDNVDRRNKVGDYYNQPVKAGTFMNSDGVPSGSFMPNSNQGNMSLPTMFGGNTPTGLFNTQQQTPTPFAPQGSTQGGGYAAPASQMDFINLNNLFKPATSPYNAPLQDWGNAYGTSGTATQAAQQPQQVSPTGSGQLPFTGMSPSAPMAFMNTDNMFNLQAPEVMGVDGTPMVDVRARAKAGGYDPKVKQEDYSTGMFGGMFNDDPNSGWWDEASGKDKFGMGMDIVGMGAGLYSMFQNQRNQKGTLDVAKGHLGVARDKLAMQQGEFDLTNKRRGVA